MDQPDGMVDCCRWLVANFEDDFVRLVLTMPNGGRRDHGPQIIATSLRWASLSPSMYRCVVWIDR